MTPGTRTGQANLNEALLYNRKLWSVFLSRDDRRRTTRCRSDVRQNVANIGMFVMNQTVSVMQDPTPEQLGSLININREIAAGLLGRG